MIVDRDGSQVKFTLKDGKKVVLDTKASFVEDAKLSGAISIRQNLDGVVDRIDLPKLKGSVSFQ